MVFLHQQSSSSSLRTIAAGLFVVSQLALVQALDIEIISTTCDQSLPVSADIYIQCVMGSRCTFGQEARIYGSLYYTDDLQYSGIENNMAYMNTDLFLWTLDFNLQNMQEISLCDETMVGDEYNENECPGAGTFDYSVLYNLPSAGSASTSWLASGWQGSGVIQMFAEADETMKIGECTMDLKTYVTRSTNAEDGTITSSTSLIGTPSAATTVGIVLGTALFLCFACTCCICCIRRRHRRNAKKVAVAIENPSRFKRMDDERTYWSSGSSKGGGDESTTSNSSSVGTRAGLRGILNKKFTRKSKDGKQKTKKSSKEIDSIVSELLE